MHLFDTVFIVYTVKLKLLGYNRKLDDSVTFMTSIYSSLTCSFTPVHVQTKKQPNCIFTLYMQVVHFLLFQSVFHCFVLYR